jgi:hypothetical protein
MGRLGGIPDRASESVGVGLSVELRDPQVSEGLLSRRHRVPVLPFVCVDTGFAYRQA